MPLLSESNHNDILNKNNINIKTKYIVENQILERNTNNSKNDDIKNGIICEKDYYIGNKLTHTEKVFDSRIEYTYIFKNQENINYTCPNCGMSSKLIEFIDGCPYCKTPYNMDYTEKDLGSKYHYDRVLRNTTYRLITGIIDIIISFILTFIFIKTTSRTFNSYDISKIFIYSIILSLILYYFFYIIDGYIILGPIKKYKDKENEKQKEFWNTTKIDKTTFFNNLNYEIRKKYYNQDNIIDYDILDYLSFKEERKDNEIYVIVEVDTRIIYLENNKIKSKYIIEKHKLKKLSDETLKLEKGVNIIKCHNCGASIDATVGKCSYCQTEIPYLQEWIMSQ